MANKTTVKITGTEQAKKSALAFINNFKKSEQFLNDLGAEAVRQIQARTRAASGSLKTVDGLTVSVGIDVEYVQPELTKYTKEQRERLIRAGNSFDPKIVKKNRSNLSLSGQLLNAIFHVISTASGEITIKLNEFRRPYKGIRKSELELKQDNKEIKKDLESRGFKFFFISQKLTILLENKIAQELRRKLSLYNKLLRK
jgi:hypothetical protein